MLTIDTHHIYLAHEPIDFRKGIDGLAQACWQQFDRSPHSGYLFVFRNRRRNALKLLVFSHEGFWLIHRRLSRGKLNHWPKPHESFYTITQAELATLLYSGTA